MTRAPGAWQVYVGFLGALPEGSHRPVDSVNVSDCERLFRRGVMITDS